MSQASRLVAFLAFACVASAAGAETKVYYQPTPFPDDQAQGAHIVDGWVTNIYYGTTFQRVEKLRIGGWADYYRTYVKFDTTGLPAHVTSAELQLNSFVSEGTPTDYTLMLPTSDWNTGMTWATQPDATPIGSYSAQTIPGWWSIPLTDIYNGWLSSLSTNFGVRLDPIGNNHQFDEFRSSRYVDDDGARPMLALTFDQPAGTPKLKMPLPRKVAWLVTTEIGGWDCTGAYDPAHDGLNYFAIDFGWSNKNKKGKQVYKAPSDGGQIPILAAADGMVVGGNWTSTTDPNGYYVVLSHDPKHKITKGFSTRYLHLQGPPIVGMGDTVVQGTTLGLMGNTGRSDGDHLHFGIRFNNDGHSNVSELSYVVMSGWLLKSFQTECLNGAPNRYYMSH